MLEKLCQLFAMDLREILFEKMSWNVAETVFGSALVGGVDAQGQSIFAGKTFTGFSNDEENQAGKVAVSRQKVLTSYNYILTLSSLGHTIFVGRQNHRTWREIRQGR